MAVGQRRPDSVIHHSDQGCQYTSLAFGERCRRWGVASSMGSVGDCFDNAMAESDQGCQYTSLAFGERCRRWGVASSMGSVGDCFDNAMAESFFATLECELLDRTRFHDHRHAQREIFTYMRGGIILTAVTRPGLPVSDRLREVLSGSCDKAINRPLKRSNPSLGRQAGQASAKRQGCALDQEARQEPLWLQESRQHRPSAQADTALPGDGRSGA